MFENISQSVAAKKREFDGIRDRIRPGALQNLERSQRIDITFGSNAIEGNTLTAGETALILEKGVTIGGKPLKDHLEAIDHAEAFDWVTAIARSSASPLLQSDVRNLHRLVLARSNPQIAGSYADQARFVNTATGLHRFPPAVDVPAAMQTFGDWLAASSDTPETAFHAHLRLVGIHPFNDGNGRTARLLMNLILLRGGYPAIAIRPEHRMSYIASLERAQDGLGEDDFLLLLYGRLDQTLDLYISAAREAEDVMAAADR